MPTIRQTTLLSTTSLLALFAAVALTTVARATNVKHFPASPVAAKPPPQNGFLVHAIVPESLWTITPGLCDAGTLT